MHIAGSLFVQHKPTQQSRATILPRKKKLKIQVVQQVCPTYGILLFDTPSFLLF